MVAEPGLPSRRNCCMMGPVTHLFAKENQLRIEAYRRSASARPRWIAPPPPWIPVAPLTLLALLAFLALFAGCATGPKPTTPPRAIPGYHQLQEEFGPRDFAPLNGRRIVLDPGHGGFYRGALGPAGLAEAEVNLGVALHLRGLLEWANAEVFLTRTADYDFLAGTDSTLAADLAFRVSMTDSLQPDVFLSIHHNSTASRDETINETQTYYPLDDEGASLDLARAIHRHLVRNLEITPAKILPGNFHVLRNATVPAVLGEPAMLSNPVMEHRLSLATSQKLEAEAYFLGLLDYFADGTPTWSGAPVDTLILESAGWIPRIKWSFLPGGKTVPGQSPVVSGPGPDPSTFELKFEGAPTDFHLSADGHSVTWQPAAPLPPRPVELTLSGRNLAGRAAAPRRTLVLPAMGDGISVRLLTSETQDDSTPLLVHWRSASGLPIAPGTLSFGKSGNPGTTILLPGGIQGWLTVEITSPAPDFSEARFLSNQSSEEWLVPIQTDTLPAPYLWRLLDGSAAGVDLASWLPDRPWRSRLWPATTPILSLQPNPTRPAIPVHPDQPTWIEVPGFLPLVFAGDSQPPGRGTVEAQSWSWPITPLLPAVMGKVILLDPAGGEGSPEGIGPFGLRGADINLAVARYTEQLLVGAGAEVHLTRSDGTLVPPSDKVRLAERVGADLFLTIGRASVPGRVTAAHHPGSATGEAWAQMFLKAWAPLTTTGDSLLAAPSWAYLLRHTACPALELGLPGPFTAADEIRLGDAAWQRAEARAILLATVAALGQQQALDLTILPPVVAGNLESGLPVEAIDWFVLDGNFLWSGSVDSEPAAPAKSALPNSIDYPLSSGHGPGLPAVGPIHTLEIHAGSRWQLWILERGENGWKSRLMLQGP